MESTYGVRNHLPRSEREQNFLKKVRGILDRGGNVLLPVVALGRAQVNILFIVSLLDKIQLRSFHLGTFTDICRTNAQCCVLFRVEGVWAMILLLSAGDAADA